MVAELLVDEPGPDRLRISGEIDTHTAPALADRLADVPAGTNLGIDLTDTTFISSAGLATLLAAAERLEAAGGSLRLTAASETVARLVELSGLADRLPIGE
ncbi:MAG: anti-sigma factor antagonist [Actinomycetota bacterium]